MRTRLRNLFAARLCLPAIAACAGPNNYASWSITVGPQSDADLGKIEAAARTAGFAPLEDQKRRVLT